MMLLTECTVCGKKHFVDVEGPAMFPSCLSQSPDDLVPPAMYEEQVLVSLDLLRDLVDATGWMQSYYLEIVELGGEAVSQDWNATVYLASEAKSIHERGVQVLAKYPPQPTLGDDLPF